MTIKNICQNQKMEQALNIPTLDEHLMANFYKSHDDCSIGESKEMAGDLVMKRVISILQAYSYSAPGIKYSDEINDRIQDAGLAVVRSVKKKKNRFNKGKSNLPTWVISVFKHKIADGIRKVQRHLVKLERYKEHLKTQKTKPPSQTDEMIANETYDKMLHTINNAKATPTIKNRLAFVFKCLTVEMLTPREISVKGGMKLGQVYRDKRQITKIPSKFNPN